ncbi:YaaC family protein [Streptomyces sp. NPDC088766]|uniref:YaaC family protein n=1 Tax=Streptomyces sp. NPDC088766 TaxID=3365893 RepID=UPI0038108418
MHIDLDAAQAWERLRASRWNPPGRADTGSRRKTYAAALEQAEQTFQAAATVGTATRPMQVFYGLSQAGRAIAAAAVTLKGEDWNLDSHAIKATGFHLPFPDIEIRTDPPGTKGSFVKVSEVLDSPVWEKDPVRLEDMWDLLPPNLRYPLTTRDRLTPLYTDEVGVGTHDHSLLSVPVCNIPDRVIDAGTREALADFLASYPAVAQHESYVTTRALSLGSEAPPEYSRYDHGGGEMTINWQMPQGAGTGFDGLATGAERLAHLRAMTRSYRGDRYFLPVLPPMKRELHPLMAWWAVLYALSMLSRYQPAAWGTLINVDNSKYAVPIERLLEVGINHLPVLIADAITEVST